MKKGLALLGAILAILLLPNFCFAIRDSLPVINSITPITTTPGTTTETITGTNFTSVQSVGVYNAATQALVTHPNFTVNSRTQITSSTNFPAGSYYFTVKTKTGTSNNSPILTVASPPPVIGSIWPNQNTAGIFDETITGSNFTNVQGVTVCDAATGIVVSSPGFTVNSGSQITAAVNLAAGFYFLKVTSDSGTSNNSPTLQVVARSQITTPDPALNSNNSPGTVWLGSSGYSTLAGAVSTLGTTRQTLFVPAGVYEVASDLTIPSNVALEVYQGAIFLIDPGVTLKIQGPFMAGPYQVFTDNSGDLTKGVKFARTCALPFVYPEWWGAVGNGGVDCAPAINQAINSADIPPGSSTPHRIPLQFLAGEYKCDSSINLVSFIGLRGVSDGSGSTVLFTPDNVSFPLIADNRANSICLDSLTFRSGQGCTGTLVSLYGSGGMGGGAIKNCSFNTSGYPADGTSYAFSLRAYYRTQIFNNTFVGNGGAFLDGCDAWFYSNQMTGPGQNNLGSTALFLVGGTMVDSNSISGWYNGMFYYWSSADANLTYNNSLSQCTYGIRNSNYGPPVIHPGGDPAGAGGNILNNNIAYCVYGYTCNTTLATNSAVILEGNLFANITGSGTDVVPTAAIFDNQGRHIVTNNTFSGDTQPMAGSGFLAYDNFIQ